MTVSYIITKFFNCYLEKERGRSSNTISAYSDSLRLLILYLCDKLELPHEKLDLEQITQEEVLCFLDHIEQKRNSSSSTRNLRLAAIKSLFHYAARERPALMLQNEQIQAIQIKKTEKKPPPSLTQEQVLAILDSVDTNTLIGQRDKAMIQLLYNTGARVQEVVNLRISDLNKDHSPTITLTGKGRKTRTIPLWDETLQLIQNYLETRKQIGIESDHLFLNNKNNPITRFGIGTRLKLYADKASEKCPELKSLSISPHVFRHTTALHLIEAGNDITIVKDWLGHADIKTTSQYVEVSIERKRKAIEKFTPPGSETNAEVPKWKIPGIIEFLERLSGKRELCRNTPSM